jgi:1,4-alpha-glucan branching enzyme
MGGEFAQRREWNHDGQLDWDLLDLPAHRGVQLLLRDLNRLYVRQAALHERDDDPAGFRWVIGDDREQSVLGFLRLTGSGDSGSLLVVCNLTPVPRHDYRIGVPVTGLWRERLNSDAVDYGGSGLGNGGLVRAGDAPAHGLPASVVLTLPPLATLILQPESAS